MKLLIMGPPGVGKGTQAKKIIEYFNIVHISTGSLLRNEIRKNSDIGVVASSFIDKGRLVPDKTLLSMVKKRLSKTDCDNGYILDGFPRTIDQASGLEKILEKMGHNLDFAISLYAEKDELVSRLIKRGNDSGRSDDNIKIIIERQKIYWEQTAPILDFYKKKNILNNINGLGKINIVTKRILKVVEKNA